jgi:putative ABC transport system substrate-binding protein
MGVRRRDFLGLIALVAAPGRSHGAGRVIRIGFLANHTPLADLKSRNGPAYSSDRVFMGEMARLGWEEGHNIHIEWRSAESDYSRHSRLADELVRMNVDLIVSFSEGAVAASKATRSIPIVMADVDPVGSGMAVSLARPGKNVTGVALSAGPGLGKSFAITKEIAPATSRLAMIIHSVPIEWADRVPAPNPQGGPAKAASALGLDLFYMPCHDPLGMEATIRGAVVQGAQAIWIEPNYGFYKLADMGRVVAAAAIHHRVPIMQGELRAVAEGGLMAYGVDYSAAYKRMAYYADRILRGASPASIPIEQPTRIEFHLNLAAAKAIGLSVPPSVLLQADRVFQ